MGKLTFQFGVLGVGSVGIYWWSLLQFAQWVERELGQENSS